MFEKHSVGDINGNGNTVHNGNITMEINLPRALPNPEESIMGSLLTNIARLVNQKHIRPSLPRTTPYNIMDKIDFNSISIYKDEYDFYDDGMFIIDEKLKIIEDINQPNIREQMFKYIKLVYVKIKRKNKNLSSDEIIDMVENTIECELKEFYHHTISPEDLSHVAFVVFYTFASCKIFDIPTEEFLSSRLIC